MANRMRILRAAARRFSTAAEAVNKNAAKGPKLPLGNDPAAFHPVEHAVGDTHRWKMISFGFGVPVLGFGILTAMNDHEHHEPPPPYEYLKRATRSPRFPWGDDDLIGTPADRTEIAARDDAN